MTELVELGSALRVYTQSVLEAQYMYREIFEEGCYGGIELPERPLIVDVGANIGMFVIHMKRTHPDAELICFEPMPDSIKLFGENMALHGLTDITLHEVALGSEVENEATFSFYPMLPANSTRYPEIKEGPIAQLAEKADRKIAEQIYFAYDVVAPVERLASYLPADRTVDLLKIDVEGAEADVLLGVDPSQWARIRQVIVEVADLDGQLNRVCGILRDSGFVATPERAPLTDERDRYYMVHAIRANAR